MSDIRGDGWGSTHDWQRDITERFSGTMGTRYFCRGCKAPFVHLYRKTPDIFTALHNFGVEEVCPVMAPVEPVEAEIETPGNIITVRIASCGICQWVSPACATATEARQYLDEHTDEEHPS